MVVLPNGCAGRGCSAAPKAVGLRCDRKRRIPGGGSCVLAHGQRKREVRRHPRHGRRIGDHQGTCPSTRTSEICWRYSPRTTLTILSSAATPWVFTRGLEVTKDIDLWVGHSPENLKRARAALEEFGAPAAMLEQIDSALDEDVLWMGVPPVRNTATPTLLPLMPRAHQMRPAPRIRRPAQTPRTVPMCWCPLLRAKRCFVTRRPVAGSPTPRTTPRISVPPWRTDNPSGGRTSSRSSLVVSPTTTAIWTTTNV